MLVKMIPPLRMARKSGFLDILLRCLVFRYEAYQVVQQVASDNVLLLVMMNEEFPVGAAIRVGEEVAY